MKALVYYVGAADMKDICDCEPDSPLEDYWTTHSNIESVEEGVVLPKGGEVTKLDNRDHRSWSMKVDKND